MNPSAPPVHQPVLYAHLPHLPAQAPHPPHHQHPQYAPPQPHPRAQAPDPLHPFRELESRLAISLKEANSKTSSRLDRIEIALGGFSKLTNEALKLATDALQETKNSAQAMAATRQDNKELLEKMQVLLLQSMKRMSTRSDKLERILGTSEAAGGEQAVAGSATGGATVLGRMQLLERAIMELAETLGDPDAARPPIVRHEMGVNTIPVLTSDAAVDASDLIPSVVRTEVCIQAEPVRMVDAEVMACTEDVRQDSPESYRQSTGSQTAFGSSPAPPRECLFCAILSSCLDAFACSGPTFPSHVRICVSATRSCKVDSSNCR